MFQLICNITPFIFYTIIVQETVSFACRISYIMDLSSCILMILFDMFPCPPIPE